MARPRLPRGVPNRGPEEQHLVSGLGLENNSVIGRSDSLHSLSIVGGLDGPFGPSCRWFGVSPAWVALLGCALCGTAASSQRH